MKNYAQTGVANGVEIGKGGAKVYSGTGTPEGNQLGSPGDAYYRVGGGAGTVLYMKETGTATNTGWVAYSAGGGGGGGKRKWVTNHNLNMTSTAEQFVPINTLLETAFGYEMCTLVPIACKITKIVVFPTSAGCGNTTIRCYKPTAPETQGSMLKSVLVNMNASAAFEFDFSSDPPLYSANDLATVSIDPTADGPDQTVITVHWEEQ